MQQKGLQYNKWGRVKGGQKIKMNKKTGLSLLFLFFLLLFVVNIFVFNTAFITLFYFFPSLYPAAGYSQTTANIISILLSYIVVLTCVVIILERRDPARTLAWLLIVIFLPVLGFVLYLVFGRHFRKRRMTAQKRVLNNYIYPLDETFSDSQFNLPGIPPSKEGLIHLILNNTEYPVTLYNDVQVLTDGSQIFPAMMKAMEAAREHIHLETYILRDDNIGSRFAEILIRKAGEGVKVRIICDALGSRALKKAYLARLRAAGIQIESFFPVRFPYLHTRINYRNHRKILVIDGCTGFVGGINIGDEYLGQDPKFGYWRDTHLRIKGTAVYFLQRIFLQDWYFITKESPEDAFPCLPEEAAAGDKIVQITSSGPDTYWEAIMQVNYYAIATAQKSIYLTSPYFVPNESILTALKTAALSGVDVKILLPAKSDHVVVTLAAMSYLEELLETGIEVYLYQNGFIHAKVLTVDGIVSVIGSANMDQRSFKLNFEANALIYDEETTLRLECDFWNDLQVSQKLSLETFRERPLLKKMVESATRLLSPLL